MVADDDSSGFSLFADVVATDVLVKGPGCRAALAALVVVLSDDVLEVLEVLVVSEVLDVLDVLEAALESTLDVVLDLVPSDVTAIEEEVPEDVVDDGSAPELVADKVLGDVGDDEVV